jgi:charged multivesicular body protein 2A
MSEVSIMDLIFGKKKTPKEIMREYKRNIDRTIRELEREKVKMGNEERKLMNDMKRAAKNNQMDAVKIMAKDIVRTRQYQTKFLKMKSQLNSVSLKLTAMATTSQMMTSMAQVTRALQGMNNRMNLPEMQKIMMEFEKQNGIMDMKEEMMSDSIDEGLGGSDETEVEEGTLLAQVFDEVGLDLQGKLKTSDQKKLVKEDVEEEKDELTARLENLKKN